MKVTEKEPETVVREVEKYKCDHCGHVVEEEDTVLLELYDRSEQDYMNTAYENKDLCHECSGLADAYRVESKMNRWGTVLEKLNYFGYGFTFAVTVLGMMVAGIISHENKAPTFQLVAEPLLGIAIAFVVCSIILLFGVHLSEEIIDK